MGVLLKRLVKEQPLGTLGGCVVLALIVVSIFAGALAPYEPGELHLVDRFQGPSARYLLGTDQLGRDLLSRLIYGARISVFVGLAGTTVHVVVAVLIGGTAGFFGGKLDLAVQRLIDAWMSFPGLLLLLTIMSIAGQGLAQMIIVLGVSAGIANSRVVRSAVIGIKGNDYFTAAEATGSQTPRTLMRHVLAQYRRTLDHHLLDHHRRHHRVRGIPEFSGIRSTARRSQLGRDAQSGRTPTHGDSPADGSVARPLPDDCRVQRKHVRRRAGGTCSTRGSRAATAVSVPVAPSRSGVRAADQRR